MPGRQLHPAGWVPEKPVIDQVSWATRFDFLVVLFLVNCRGGNQPTPVGISSIIEPLLGTSVAFLLLDCSP